MGTRAVRITGGRKAFRGNTVLSGIDLAVDDGEFVAVLGRSGSGKTTLLRVLAGLETLDAGSLEWRESGGERPHTGVVFQRALLMPWLTVAENIRFGRRFAAHRASFENDYALGLLRRFGLDGLADRYPDQLSGGQAQRVAIIRAAAIRPRRSARSIRRCAANCAAGWPNWPPNWGSPSSSSRTTSTRRSNSPTGSSCCPRPAASVGSGGSNPVSAETTPTGARRS